MQQLYPQGITGNQWNDNNRDGDCAIWDSEIVDPLLRGERRTSMMGGGEGNV